MRSDDSDFPFGPNYNFGTNSLFTARNVEQGNPFPIVSGEMDLLDGTHMLLLDGTDMLLL